IIALSVHYHEIGFVVAFLIVAPVCMVPVRLLGRKLRRRSREWAEHSSIIAQHIWENFNGIHEIRSFSLESAQQKGFAQKLHSMLNTQFKIKKYLLLQQPSMELVVSLMVSGIFVYACLRGISFATFTAFGLALYMAFDPIKRIGQALNTLHQTEPNADRLMEFFSIKPDIQDPPHPKLLDNVRGEIVFDNVTFAYGDEPVLREVSITIPAGTNCALVGRSGAGKSTFAKLIPRFYEVRQGRVTLDGTDVRDVRQADLRRHIAVVSQHPVLFDMPILENIRLGRPGATDAEVMDATKRAYADSFIRSFPEGYNTMAGDRGDRLSGGQKQRIALARAFLKNAPVLLLDEAVSALDSESEQAIMAALNDLSMGRTVLTIAHRLSTIRNSKLILVFDNGRLAAQGTHAELMKNSPIYAELVNRQLDDTNTAG
ncbi:MAG TPA: ABC transporter ATP-binding protein, partial [Opitutales bacterium]|nr:ABC transporter ATP-binding protein [Opitutales bacterium]